MNSMKIWATTLGFALVAGISPSYAAFDCISTMTGITQDIETTEEGQPVVFTSTVISNFLTKRSSFTAMMPPAAGKVVFVNMDAAGAVLGEGTLVDGVATFQTTTLPVGSTRVQAQYFPSSPEWCQSISPEPQVTHIVTAAPVVEPEPEPTPEPTPEPVNTASGTLGATQNAASTAAGSVSTDLITDTVGEEVSNAIAGNNQFLNGGANQMGVVYAPGVNPVADLPTMDQATVRFWGNLRYTNLSSTILDGDHLNGLLGVTGIFGNGMVAGLVTGYENFNYEDAVGGILDGDGYSLGGYAGGNLGNGFRFDGQVHGAMINYDVSNPGATGAFDATRLVVSGGFSHRTEFGNGLIFEPNLRATGTWEWQDGYTDSLAVAHAARAVNFGRLSSGIKLSKNFVSDGGTLTPFIGASGEYRFSSGAIVGTSVLDGLSARIETGFDFTSTSGIGMGLHGEMFGLGLNNKVVTTSVKANVVVPF